MNKRQLEEIKKKDVDWKCYNELTQRERIWFKKTNRFSWSLIQEFFFKNNEEGD